MTHTLARRRGAVLLSALAAALLVGLGGAPAALAHNTLVSSSPKDGARLDRAPEEVTLTFNADVGEGNNVIAVTGPDGTEYQDGAVAVDGAEASVPLKPLPEAGEYTVGYRVVSADGHPLEEQLTFTLTEKAVTEATDAPGTPSPEETGPTSGATPPAEGGQDETAASDPMSALGPVGGVVAAIAIIALMVILVVRLRRRPGGPGSGGAQ